MWWSLLCSRFAPQLPAEYPAPTRSTVRICWISAGEEPGTQCALTKGSCRHCYLQRVYSLKCEERWNASTFKSAKRCLNFWSMNFYLSQRSFLKVSSPISFISGVPWTPVEDLAQNGASKYSITRVYWASLAHQEFSFTYMVPPGWIWAHSFYRWEKWNPERLDDLPKIDHRTSHCRQLFSFFWSAPGHGMFLRISLLGFQFPNQR